MLQLYKIFPADNGALNLSAPHRDLQQNTDGKGKMKNLSRAAFRGTFGLVLVALGACGGGSGGGGGGNPEPPPPDVTAPTVSAVTVPAGSTLNRTVTLSATASDVSGVAEVRFLLDGVLLGSDATSPYSFEWDTSTVADGNYTLRAEADDTAGNTAQSADLSVTVDNEVEFSITLSGDQQVPVVSSAGTAQAALTVNLATGAVSGSVVVNTITPVAAHIHDGFAGTNGGVVIGLEADPGIAGQFNVPAAATLDSAGVDRLLEGGLYVNVHTAQFQSGELRGQILTADQVLVFTDMSGRVSVPQKASLADGRAALTLNTVTGDLVVQVNANGLDDGSDAHVHEAYAGSNGPVMVALTQDGSNPGRWFAEGASLSEAGLAAFEAGRLYVNVHSPAYPGGEIRGQLVPESIAVIYAELSGLQAVPLVDTRAAGLAAVTLDESGSLASIHVNTTGIDDAAAAHLHGAFAGLNGGVEIPLVQDGSDPAHWSAEEETVDAAQLAAILSGATYVNVHSPNFQGGEIRGQVIPDGILFAYGMLEGRQQVPPVTTSAGGTFAVTVDPDALTLQAHANTTGADDAIGAHLHDAFAGTNGGVAVALTQDATTVSRWSATDVPIDAGQLDAVSAGRWYVNVHTPANGTGEVRGQVAPPPIEVLFTDLSGEQEVPAVTTAASGLGASTVNLDTGDITVHVRTTGADTAVGAHVHSAFAGDNGGVAIGLVQDAGDIAHWVAEGAQLDAAGLADYLDGRLYYNVHTPANGSGEIRGQIAPRDIQVVFADLTGDQVVPPVVSGASGKAATTTNLRTRSFTAFVNTQGADDATGASIKTGGASENGTELLALQQSATVMSRWSAMIAALSMDELRDYRAGGLYAEVYTPMNPNGAIRGQIDPPGAVLFDNESPAVSLTSPGAEVSGTVTLEATASDDRGVVEVRFLADGVLIEADATDPYSVSWDTTTSMNGDVQLTAEAEDEAGNVGVSASVTVTVNNAAPVTLGQIQTQVFGPTCSGCHSGPTSNSLPSGMNLSSAGESFAALVNVPSLQQGMLNRVEPGDPDSSYLIRKLEGGPDISGSRMPVGGPFLSQEMMDMIRQWISDGAPNN